MIFYKVLNHPLTVVASTVFGVSAMSYLQDRAIDAAGWFIPCLFLILADLAAGIRAARFRGEKIRMSTALRRTGNKIVVYSMWIVVCVALNYKYDSAWIAKVGMGITLGIEAISFITNILEPKGWTVNPKSVLDKIGDKHGINELGDTIEKKKRNNGKRTDNK